MVTDVDSEVIMAPPAIVKATVTATPPECWPWTAGELAILDTPRFVAGQVLEPGSAVTILRQAELADHGQVWVLGPFDLHADPSNTRWITRAVVLPRPKVMR